mmetsp:Transcript_27060/g.63222  ORF Transcript_27060/g.63222 Transcript_27060/m.63222 type:complete len:279 (-) Transcript_27060:131-967(-)
MLRFLSILWSPMRPSWKSVKETIAFAMPMPCPRKMPRRPNAAISASISLMAAKVEIEFPLIEFVCMITSRRESGFVMTTYIGETTADATRFVAEPERVLFAPSCFCTYFCSCGWPTRPSSADASEWPMSGTVPRKSGKKYFAADSLRISRIGFSVPVCLKKARCCFSIIRTGLMNGAENMEAPVAAKGPTSPESERTKERPSRMPNFGTRLKSTPTSRGQSPDMDAVMGDRRKTALASSAASFGSTGLPSRPFAYCCTSCRYAVTGLSPTVWIAEPPR